MKDRENKSRKSSSYDDGYESSMISDDNISITLSSALWFDGSIVATRRDSRAHTIPVADKIEGDKSDWKSIHIANFLSMFVAMQFSFFITATYPYLSSITCGHTTQFFYGCVIAIFSACQGVSSPLYGLWANRTHKSRAPIVVGCILMFIGNFTYALAGASHSDSWRENLVMIGRAITGLGAGALGVIRAYVATASTSNDRNKAVSLNSAFFATGIALGPGLQSFFAPIGFPGVSLFGGIIYINMYTTPAFIGMACLLVALGLLFCLFTEQYAGIVPEETKTDRFFVLPKFKWLPVLVCLLIWFVQACVASSVETVISPYTMIMYDWDGQEALQYTGYILLISAFVSVIIYILYAYTALSSIDHRISVIGGMVAFFSFYLFTFPYWFWNDSLPLMKSSNSTHDATTSVPNQCQYSVSAQLGGCDNTIYSWCYTSKQIPLVLFWIAYDVGIGLGYPPTNSPLMVLYSRVLGPRRQGSMQGLILLSGSLARTLAPVIIMKIFQEFGPMYTWLTEMVIILIAIVAIGVNYNELIPLKTVKDMKTGTKIKHKHGVVYKL